MSKTNTVAKTVNTTEVKGISLNEADQAKFDGMTTKSARIRFLSSLGYKNGPIAKYLTGVYYPNGEKAVLFQHVRNVLKTPIKTAA